MLEARFGEDGEETRNVVTDGILTSTARDIGRAGLTLAIRKLAIAVKTYPGTSIDNW